VSGVRCAPFSVLLAFGFWLLAFGPLCNLCFVLCCALLRFVLCCLQIPSTPSDPDPDPGSRETTSTGGLQAAAGSDGLAAAMAVRAVQEDITETAGPGSIGFGLARLGAAGPERARSAEQEQDTSGGGGDTERMT
jgi:hypothetical protein